MAHLTHRPYTAWEYALMAALPLGLVVLLPILGVLAFIMRGAVLVAVASVGAAAAIAAAWHAWSPGVRSMMARRRSAGK